MKLTFIITAITCCWCSITLCAPVTTNDTITIEKRGLDSCYKKGNAKFTFYWIPKEGEEDMNNKGKTVYLTGDKTKKLKDKNKKLIANVCKKTKQKIRMEGTGLLANGILVNLGRNNNEFMVLDRKATPYGLGSGGTALVPWVSVAANDIKLGTTLYIKELDGVKLPHGEKHNGCVRIDDDSWSMGGCQIDFFTLQYSAYKDLNKKLPSKVTVKKDTSCKIKNYVTSSIKSWAEL